MRNSARVSPAQWVHRSSPIIGGLSSRICDTEVFIEATGRPPVPPAAFSLPIQDQTRFRHERQDQRTPRKRAMYQRGESRALLLGEALRVGESPGDLRGLCRAGSMPGGGSRGEHGVGRVGWCHLLGWSALPSSTRQRTATHTPNSTYLSRRREASCWSWSSRLSQPTASSRSPPGVDGWRILARALASIWRIRSRVTLK